MLNFSTGNNKKIYVKQIIFRVETSIKAQLKILTNNEETIKEETSQALEISEQLNNATGVEKDFYSLFNKEYATEDEIKVYKKLIDDTIKELEKKEPH